MRRFLGRADRVSGRRFGAASLFIDPSGQQAAASFQHNGIAAGSQAVVTFSNALIDPSAGLDLNVTAPAGYLMVQDIFLVAANSTAPVDATASFGLNMAAGATRLTGSARLPAGATGPGTIGMGGPVPISGDFSVPLQ
jgi:hypothetical protein